MSSIRFEEIVEKIVQRDPRYHRDAYCFLREALSYTQKQSGKIAKNEVRHVTGRELLAGIQEYALAQFGPMTVTVLEEWGVRGTEDFGELVFNMVENNLLAKTENDTRADFKDGYDFREVFIKPFIPSAQPGRETKPVV